MMCKRSLLLTIALLFVAGILPINSQASLINVGNGLIYDTVSDVTWISNGLTFPNDIAATTTNPTANPYTGPLLG
ncbi:MAG: hypothetical protein MRJ68_19485, partial [Nitrospira sp.]|nr:hypothetical protein [Nitrospira sp.]